MRNIKYIGTKPTEDAFFDRTQIIWTPGKIDTVLDDAVATEMLRFAEFEDAGDSRAFVGSVSLDPTTGAMQIGGAAPTSAQRASVRAGIGGQLFDNFDGKPDGPVVTSDSHHVYALQHTVDANRLRIVGGGLTNVTTANAQAAGYAEVAFDRAVSRIGGAWEFGAKTTDDGSATFAVWGASYPGTGAVPDSPCHISVTTKKWAYSVYTSGVIAELATGDFATELAQDGTLYFAEVIISGQTAHISLPNGTRALVTDSRIQSNAGNIAVFEVFQNNASTDSKVKFSSIRADQIEADGFSEKTTTYQDVLDFVARESLAWRPTVYYYAPSPAANVTITTTMAALDHTNLAFSFIAPPSGRVLIEIQAFVSSTTRVLFAIERNESGSSETGSTHDLTGIAMNGVADYSAQLSGLTPGRSYKYSLRGQAITSTATLLADSANGRVFWMKATPF